jgi:esterase/lipase
MKKLLRIALIGAAGIALGWLMAAQQPAPKPQEPQVVTPKAPYDSTKAQLLVTKEENLQLQANASQAAFQQQMKDFQDEWKAEEAALNAWIAEVKKANGWDDTYTYDRTADKWTHTPKVEAKKPEAKPAEAPKK